MCLNFLIVKIGCDNDNTIKIDTEEFVKVVNTVVQSFIAKSDANVETFNKLSIAVGNSGVFNCPGGFNIYQTNQNNVTTVNDINLDQISQINTSIVDDVRSQLTQEQVQGILAFLNSIGQAGSVNNETDITNKVKEAVMNAVTQEITTGSWAGAVVNNDLTITNNGLIEGGACNIVQQNILNVRVTNLVTAVQTTLQNDQFLNYLLTYDKQTNTSGLTFNWLTYLIIGIVVIGVLLVIGAIIVAVKVA